MFKKKQRAADRLSGRSLWSFSLGGIGRDTMNMMFNAYLLSCIMLTKGLSTGEFALIGVIIMVARIFDGVIDPFIGAMIESTHTKWGKFKPWIISGAISNSIVVFLMFWMPLSGMSFVIFFAFAQILLSITFSINDIAYWSMIPALTSHPADRDKLSSVANACASLGAGIASWTIPVFTSGSLAIGGSAVIAYPAMAVIVGCFFIACQTLTVLGVQEKPLPPVGPEKKKTYGLKEVFAVLKGNDQLLWTFFITIISNVGGSIMGGLSTWYVYFRFGYEGALVSLFGAIAGASNAILLLYPILSKKFSRKIISKIALCMIFLGYGLMLGCGLVTQDATSASGGVFFTLALCGIFYSAGQSFFYQVTTITFANTVEYNEWKTGKREESIIFSLRPLASQIGASLQMGVITIVLTILGIDRITDKISEQENLVSLGLLDAETKLQNISAIIDQVPNHVTNWLLVCMTVLPVIMLTAAIVLYWKKTTLNEATYEKLRSEISERKAAK